MKRRFRIGDKCRPGSRYWRYKTDRLWSRLILRKNGGRCARCGKPATDPHHIIPRGRAATRHDLRNGLPLCRGCHDFMGQYPALAELWLANELPETAAWVDQNRYKVCPSPNYRKRFEQLRDILAHAEGRRT